MKHAELEQYAQKLVSWYEEGCHITRDIDEKQDYYEIIVTDTDGVKSYQEFNYYLGNKLWNIYLGVLNEKLSSNN